MKKQGQPNVSEKQVTKKKTKRSRESPGICTKRREREGKKKNLELYKENLEKEALHAEENIHTRHFTPENCYHLFA